MADFIGAGALLPAFIACILREKPDRGSGNDVTERLQLNYLARHGETIWTIAGWHRGRNDLPTPGTAKTTPGI